MRRTSALVAVLSLGVAAAAGAGLVFAQDGGQNQTTPAGGQAANAVTEPQAPAVIAAPPEEAAPAAPPAETAPKNVAETAPPPAPPPTPAEPPRRPRYAAAVLEVVDKITAETLRFQAMVNQPVRYRDLVITVRACETSAADEPPGVATAHLLVQAQPDVLPGRAPPAARQVFQGWMFAQAPGVHPFEHPIYDLMVIACRTPSPAGTAPAGGASL